MTDKDMLGKKVSEVVDELLDTAGDSMATIIDCTGHSLQEAAARVADVAGDVVKDVSDFVDDSTEHGPLKEWGDEFGREGRAAAQEIEDKSDELEEDLNPTRI